MSDAHTPVHMSVLLDRSGSMASIADDVVGGFNTFLREQREEPGTARVTLVQFDGQDPFEVLIDGEDLGSVDGLDARRYLPRGNTPLLDAVGAMIARIDGEIVGRADEGMPIEDQVVVIITDGCENASREFSGQMISDLIAARRERAWTFVFLGADEGSIRDSVAIGVATRSTTRWDATKQGTGEMFGKLSKETVNTVPWRPRNAAPSRTGSLKRSRAQAVDEATRLPGELTLCLICFHLRGLYLDKEHRCRVWPSWDADQPCESPNNHLTLRPQTAPSH